MTRPDVYRSDRREPRTEKVSKRNLTSVLYLNDPGTVSLVQTIPFARH